MAKITGPVSPHFTQAGSSSDAGYPTELDERLKKAKKEQGAEAMPPVGLIPPLLRMFSEPPPAVTDFARYTALTVKADYQMGNWQHPPRYATATAQTTTLAAEPLTEDRSLPQSAATKSFTTPSRDTPSMPRGSRPFSAAHNSQRSVVRESLTPPGSAVALSDNTPADRPLDKSRREENSAAPLPALPPPLPGDGEAVAKSRPVAAKSESHQLFAQASVRPAKSAPSAEGQNKISYSFSSWGREHRVVLTTVRDSSQQLAVMMTPSDALVSHRLQYAISAHPPVTAIALREERGDGQQQRDKQQSMVDEE